MDYFLGVDGGGTKSDLALFDKFGKLAARKRIGCTNHEHLLGGYAELGRMLKQAAEALTKDAMVSINQIRAGVFGLAGVDTPRQQREITSIIQAGILKNAYVYNDAYLAIKAGCPNGFGAAAVNGTGCTVAGIDRRGEQMQIGGLGDASGDCGGGDYLAGQMLASVYASLYKNAPKTVMTDLLRRTVGAAAEQSVFNEVMDLMQSGDLLRSDLNKIVFQAANQEDSQAREILVKMGVENGRSLNSLIDVLDFGSAFDVVFGGSIYVKGENPTAIEMIKKTVTEAHPDRSIRFHSLGYPLVAGAAIWAAEIFLPPELYAPFYRQALHSIT